MLLSALLGTLGSVAVMAQSNVYSLNAVGYINVTLLPNWNIVTCPLISSPDNTLATLLPNTTKAYGGPGYHMVVYAFTGGTYSGSDTAVIPAASPNGSGWISGGTLAINPGSAVWIFNPFTSNLNATWVGTVPSGSQTNALISGYSLVGSIVPATGDLITNSITHFTGQNKNDVIYAWDPVNQGYYSYEWFPAFGIWGYNGSTSTPADPTVTNIYEGFYYFNNSSTSTTLNWVETYSVTN